MSGCLAAAVSDQVRGLGALGLAALVMVDEPGLMAAQRAGATVALWDPLRAAAPAWGLHVCGEVPWGLVDAAEPHVISYDLGRFGCVPAAHAVIRRLMRRGGRIMWGAIDPTAAETPSQTVGRVCAAARAVAGRRLRTMDVLDASLLSGACGTGGVDAEAERAVAHGLQVAAGLLRGDPLPAQPSAHRHDPDGEHGGHDLIGADRAEERLRDASDRADAAVTVRRPDSRTPDVPGGRQWARSFSWR